MTPTRRLLAMASLALLLAAGAAIIVARRSAHTTGVGQAPPTRSLEARLAQADASAHRPLGPRASALASSPPLASGSAAAPALAASARIASLQKAGDKQALAEAYLETGEVSAAEAELGRLPAGPNVDSDKALAAMMRGQSERALSLLEATLKARPDHPQALWNRALLLRDLGLLATAQAAFTRAASLGEPGWSAEAKDRAASLGAQVAERRALHAAVLEAVLGDGDVRPPPGAPAGLLRHAVYEGLRAAGDKGQALRLLPLVSGLGQGANALEDEVKRVSELDFRERGRHAQTYRQLLIAPRLPDRAQQDALADGFRRAKELDLVAGLAALTGREVDWLEDVRVGFRGDDPWQRALTVAAEARAERAPGQGGQAPAASREQQLRAGLAACEAARLDYPCAQVELELASVEAGKGRADAARNRAASALRRALRAKLGPLEVMFLRSLAEVTRALGDQLLAQAYEAEAAARDKLANAR